MENGYTSMKMSHHGYFEIFRIKIRAKASEFFLLMVFLHYIDIHMVHEREICTPLRSHISLTVNVGAELIKCLYGNLS